MAYLPLPDECEAWLPDGSVLVAEEMGSGLGWNSPYHTRRFSKEMQKGCQYSTSRLFRS